MLNTDAIISATGLRKSYGAHLVLDGVDLRTDIAVPSEPLRAVHAAIRERVPMMDVDREVSEQIITVDELLPALVGVAAAECGGLR